MNRTTVLLIATFSFGAFAHAQSALGNYTAHEWDGRTLKVYAGSSAVRMVLYKPDVLRVDLLPSLTTLPDSSFAVIRDTSEAVSSALTVTDSTIEIATSTLRVVCSKRPLRISYADPSGRPLLKDGTAGGFRWLPGSRSASFALGSSDHFYGTGERSLKMDLRGLAFSLYNVQSGGYSTPLSTMNVNVPFVISSSGYALFFDNTYQGQLNLGYGDSTSFSYSASGGELSYYFFAGSVPHGIELYTWLTGRAPLPPRWAFGFIQSKYGYGSNAEASNIIQTMRNKQIPCDGLVLDLYWYRNMGDMMWDFSAWPAPWQMLKDFRTKGIKTILITEPYIVQPSANYPVADQHSYFTRNSTGQTYILNGWWSCGCPAGLLDMTNPSAQQWWWGQYTNFMANGFVPGGEVGGLWTDLGEPEQHPLDMQHFLGTTAKVHNIYDLLWAKTVFDGYGQFRPGQRLFNLTRSGFAGIQRYGVATWSGDVAKSFGGLAVQVPMLLHMGMSGIAYHNSDIGGFCCGLTTDELYVRWMQFGAFCPVTRAHGTGQPTEPWGFGPAAEGYCRTILQLRYRLLPYIYSTAFQTFSSGMPMARPLFFEDPSDANLTNTGTSYLFGSSLLVSPVLQQGQTSMNLYLPRGDWIDFWTDGKIQGGQTISVSTPIDRIPLFVKAGSIIPMQPVMNYSDERPVDTLTLAVYPNQGTSSFTIYEDDGLTREYQSGAYAQTTFTQTSGMSGANPVTTVLVGASGGSFAGKLGRRTYRLEIHQALSRPSRVAENGTTLIDRSTPDSLSLGLLGFAYDPARQLLVVQISSSTDSACSIVAANLQTTGVQGRPTVAATFSLDQNFPNPFNPSTTIRYSIPTHGFVTLKVYDTLGRWVTTLVSQEQSAGEHTVVFDARGLSSGTYFCRLSFAGRVETRVMTAIK